MSKIRELRRRLDSREISAVELATEYITRAEASDCAEYITVTRDTALTHAAAAQRLIYDGKAGMLTGIPIAVKDNICTAGIATTCGSRMLSGFDPGYDADVVERLNGAVLVGKTAMDEFAMGGSTQTSELAKTKNPRDKTRVPGGSSGGSAAAVANDTAVAALGSDTGGSIRQPASFCGVCGIKPTYGRVSRYGLIAFASSLDQIGTFGTTAGDCAILLNAVAGYDKRDGTSANLAAPDFTAGLGAGVKGLKIALPPEYYTDVVDSGVRASVLNAARSLEKAGAVLIDDASVSAGQILEYAVPAYYLISSAEAASNLSRYDGLRYGLAGDGGDYNAAVCDSRDRGFGAEVKRRILLGNYALSSGYYDAYYRKALGLRQEISAIYARILDTADVIITPTAPTTAYPIDGGKTADPVQMYLGDVCTVTVNLAGLPAISVPCGNDGAGLPVGLSVVGRKWDEGLLFTVAAEIERLSEV